MLLPPRPPSTAAVAAGGSPELPQRWVRARRTTGFLDTHRDVVIAVSAILAAFGAVLGAIASGVAGSHPNYDVLTGGYMLAAYVLFGASSVIISVLFYASVSTSRWRRRNRMRLSEFIASGYELYRRKLQTEEEVPGWHDEITAWQAYVGAQIECLMDKPSLMVFENDVDLQDPGTSMTDDVAVNMAARAQKLRLARRIQNLHRLMAGT